MWNDIRFALRTMRRHSAITIVVVVTLALGIGANTALFSVFNSVLLRDLPYPDPGQIYLMRSVTTEGSSTGPLRPREARPLYEVEDHPTVEAAALAWSQEAQIIGGDDRAYLTTRYGVTDQFFEVFLPQMELGRGFERGENPGVAVLAYSTWRDLFGSDPEIIGKVVQLDPGPSPVVGVAPPGFEFPGDAGYWWLMRLGTGFDRIRGYTGFLRLRPDRSGEQIETDITTLVDNIGPDPFEGRTVALVAQPLFDYVVGDLAPTVAILFGATGVLLLIASINVTNLLLSRVTARARELSLREAVGAGRWRLVRQLLTESLMLSLAGGVLGVAVAGAGLRLLPWIAPQDLPRIDGVALDSTVLLFALGTTIVVGLLVGVAPLWRVVRNPIRSLVNEAGRGEAAGGGRNRVFGSLVVAEVGLAVLLVLGAGLLVRSYINLTATDPGFDPDGMLAFAMNVPSRGYAPLADFFRDLSGQVEGIAGVEAVGTTTSLPLKQIQYDLSPAFHIVGAGPMTPETALTAVTRSVSPGFFPAMRIPLRAGRNFDSGDRRGSAGVAIVNETFARRFFPDGDAVGQRLRYLEPSPANQLSERTADEVEVIGIVPDVRYTRLAEPPPPAIYLSSEQLTYRRLTFVVRTTLDDPGSLVPAIQREIEALDPLVTAQFDLYPPIIRASTARERMGVTLLVSFGLMAMVLAAVGIYGLMSHSVTGRTGEMAVRSALGASSGELVRLVLRRGLALALAGILLGGVAAVALRRLVASQLYGVSSLDSVVFILVPLLLMAVAAIATLIPANRVRHVDPAEMLRIG